MPAEDRSVVRSHAEHAPVESDSCVDPVAEREAPNAEVRQGQRSGRALQQMVGALEVERGA